MATRRTRARETALQMLYQHELNPDLAGDVVREQVLERLEDEALSRFAWSLYMGVLENLATLDAGIERVAANWSLRRMAHTDRNVLRIGAFELSQTETPPRVIVDEAIELARKYGSAQSAQFVNGILDRLIPGPHRRSPAPESKAGQPLSPSTSVIAFAEVESGPAGSLPLPGTAGPPLAERPVPAPAALEPATIESLSGSRPTETGAVVSPMVESTAVEVPGDALSAVEPTAVARSSDERVALETRAVPATGLAPIEAATTEFERRLTSLVEPGTVTASGIKPDVDSGPAVQSDVAGPQGVESKSGGTPEMEGEATVPETAGQCSATEPASPLAEPPSPLQESAATEPDCQ